VLNLSNLHFRKNTLELIAIKILNQFENGKYLYGQPKSIPIEEMIEQEFGLNVEYHYLRKDFRVLGQTVFENSFVPIYDNENKEYTVIEVNAGTIIIDSRLNQPRFNCRFRFTLAHELSHWVIHKKLFVGTGEAIAKIKEENDDETEWQADQLSASILMPKGQIKKYFYQLSAQGYAKEVVEKMSELFDVSKQAMSICLKSHNLI